MAVTTEQVPKVAGQPVDRPVAAFVLSLIAALCILAGGAAVMTTTFPVNASPYYYGGMMGGYYGGMMGGYYGMMNVLGVGGGWFYGLGAIGTLSGIIVLVGAVMMYSRPIQTATWGALIVAFSVVSFFGMGGFFIGAISGLAGGILALTWKK